MSIKPFETEERPNEESVVSPALEVLLQLFLHKLLVEIGSADSTFIVKNIFNIRHGRASIPVLVGRGKPLLVLVQELFGQVILHGIPQN